MGKNRGLSFLIYLNVIQQRTSKEVRCCFIETQYTKAIMPPSVSQNLVAIINYIISSIKNIQRGFIYTNNESITFVPRTLFSIFNRDEEKNYL
jgi:hypothetical protein